MKIAKEKTVAFTGHRTLVTADGQPDANLENVIRTELSFCLENCRREGKKVFISGMAIGWDMLCAEEVLKLKKKYSDITFIAAIPFQGQELLYNDRDKDRFKTIYEAADHIELITDGGYDNAAYHKRNDWMIANGSELIAYDSGKPRSGTSSTIRKALKEGLEILNMFVELQDYFAITHPAKKFLQDYPDVPSFRYGREGVIFEGNNQPFPVTFEQLMKIARKDDMLHFFLIDGLEISASLSSVDCSVITGIHTNN